ncbi:HAD-IA family hydrolase [Profundibacter sp.]|uniref:HAD-IA family hydrolase n=1 Tax=Profundibacter sp. TaxID=3101071 RepID=UPI003D13A296
MSQPLRLAVFDVDGTLVDSQHHIAAAMAQTYTAEGMDGPPLEQVRGIIGLLLPHAMRQLSPDLTDVQYDALVEGYKATFRNKREAGQSAPLYAGVRDLLDRLAQDDHLLLGVATGKSRRGLDAMLRVHGLEKMFVTAQVADDHPSKPHPSMLHATLSETGVAGQHGVMIGDTTFDMEMGRAAGMVSIGVSWGYHDVGRLRAAGAAHIVDDTVALAALLTELWG